MRRPTLGLVLACALACASPPAVRTTLPALGEGDTDPAAGYEEPPLLRAQDLLPASLLRSEHHQVAPEVVSNGFIRRYRIESQFGVFEAHGDEMLRERVGEIRALAALGEVSKSKEFARAMSQGLQVPFVAAWNLIRSPVDSISGLPAGAWGLVQRAADLATSERGELEDNAFREFIGFEAKKREIAARLEVDPYSSNKVLQRELNRLAWVTYAGGLPFMQLVPFQKVGAPQPPVLGPEGGDRLRDLLLHYSPEDLRRFNRIELAVMGVPPEERSAFLTHPWYSPRHATVLVEALANIDPAQDQATFLHLARSARSEYDAFFFQRAAELLRAYHESAVPLGRFVAVAGVPAAHSAEGRLVVAADADYVVWTRPVERFAESIREELARDGRVVSAALLLSGGLSPQARTELERRGIAVVERALESLAPQPVALSRGAP